jgi:hypothetical protein
MMAKDELPTSHQKVQALSPRQHIAFSEMGSEPVAVVFFEEALTARRNRLKAHLETLLRLQAKLTLTLPLRFRKGKRVWIRERIRALDLEIARMRAQIACLDLAN